MRLCGFVVFGGFVAGEWVKTVHGGGVLFGFQLLVLLGDGSVFGESATHDTMGCHRGVWQSVFVQKSVDMGRGLMYFL